MFSIADLLERAKARANIDSDYRLAKVIGITHQAMTQYRGGKTLPNESVIEQLCALSGDDPDVIAAQIQAARSKTPEARNMWLRVAARMSGAASTAILSVLAAIVLIAASAMPERVEAAMVKKSADLLSYTSSKVAVLSVGRFLMVRLRQFAGLLRLSFGLCLV